MCSYCCDNFKFYIEDDTSLLFYYQEIRKFYLLLRNDNYGTHQEILFCPWCGTRLPENLENKMFEILEKEYGITDPFFDDADRVPEEFKTDKWWKKRGL